MTIDKNELNRQEREKAFLEKAKEMNRDYIDYSKVHYINNRTLVTFIDKEYGEFQMTPSNFLKGKDCKQRKGAKISNTKGEKYNTEWFIKRARETHGDLYDYSKTVYTGAHNKVIIIDPEYGEFEQEANSHLRGAGHPQRAIDENANKKRYTKEQFEELARLRHPNADYDFSLFEYTNGDTKVPIFCNKIGANGKPHGVFYMKPSTLLRGKGCPKCGNSLSVCEDEIANELAKHTKVIQREKTILGGKEIDIYLPEYKLGIEYNGCLYHSERYRKDSNYHLDKTLKCEEKGIELIQIFEDEYKLNKKLVISYLNRKLGFDRPLLLDKDDCIIKEIDSTDAEFFMDKNSIKGFTASTLYIGAFNKNSDDIIALFSFEKTKDNDVWELNRISYDYKYKAVGIENKIFNYFIDNFKPVEVRTMVDRRWNPNVNDNVYLGLSFMYAETIKPNYTYYNSNVDTINRFNRYNFRREILHKKYNLPLTMTEQEMAESLGYYRIWDCGYFRFVWKKNERN